MLYMVIEHYKPGALKAIYERFHARGRMMPKGLVYINSWVVEDGTKCFQVMECDDESLLHIWAKNWEDLCEFEFIRVVSSSDMSNSLTV